MTKPYIDIRNAQLKRGNKTVFSDLSLSVSAGQHTAILGPNGSGKTTLLQLLCRQLYPIAQPHTQVKLFDQEHVDLWELRKKTGFVSHEYHTCYESLDTGFDVVLSGFFGSVGLHSHHKVAPEQIKKAEQILRDFAILDLRNKPFLQLSTGQQRRILLARACVHRPKLLILDEPTASLDIGSTHRLLASIRTLAQKGITQVLVTHHLHEVVPEIDRVLLLKHGQIIYEGTKRSALTSDRLSELFDTPLKVQEAEGYYQWSPG